MFESLSDKLQSAFRSLTGQNQLSEGNIAKALEEVKDALFEADVSYEVVQSFVERMRGKLLGLEVHKAVNPYQQVIKLVSDELTTLMGEKAAPLNLGDRHPAVVMMVGLHGSGKTTSTAKLAALIRKTLNKRPLLVAGDIYRPAAITQLQVLGESLKMPVYAEPESKDVAAIAMHAVAQARAEGNEVVLIDTAGRFQIDEVMVQELIKVRDVVQPTEILLVADAALGQQAVSVARHFHEALGITGVILTKLDGDARGGAALSIRHVTQCPIKWIGSGEKIEDFEVFHPDRMASRVLGMGDIVSLVERSMEQSDAADLARMEAQMKKKDFDFNDFLSQIKQMQKLGGLESILKMLPGGNKLLSSMPLDTKQFKRVEAMIYSMTPYERENPDAIDFSRRKRIAKGSGMQVEQAAQIINQFNQMRKMFKGGNPFGGMGKGGFPGMGGGMPGMGGGFPGFGAKRGSNFTPPKKKRKK